MFFKNDFRYNLISNTHGGAIKVGFLKEMVFIVDS